MYRIHILLQTPPSKQHMAVNSPVYKYPVDIEKLYRIYLNSRTIQAGRLYPYLV